MRTSCWWCYFTLIKFFVARIKLFGCNELHHNGDTIVVVTAQEIVNFLNELRGFVRIQVITICLECRDNLRSTSHKLAVNFTIKVRLLTVCFAPRPERYKEIVLSYRIATLDNILLDEKIVF